MTMSGAEAPRWVDVGSLSELRRRRKQLVEVGETPVALFLHDDRVHALANICIHRQRELVKGVILNGRVICPGHQWAFDLDTGLNEKNCLYQPSYDVRVEDDRVLVRAEARAVPETTLEEPAIAGEG